MLQPEMVHKKSRLTLQDLHTVIEIYQGTYNFSASHPEIKRNYINTKIYAKGGEKHAFFQPAETEMDLVTKIYNEI